MKIAIVYFEQNLTDDRSHHSVGHNMLNWWQKYYENSGSTLRPCLLVDRKTKVPDLWKYDSVVVENDTPAICDDVLNKVGWIKHQAYDLIGRCVVMDLDAIVKCNIDDLVHVEAPIAMAPDEGTYRKWHWSENWPDAKYKYNAGVICMNSGLIGCKFRTIWDRYIEYINITYFDEIIFSSLMTELNGQVLDNIYNTQWNGCNVSGAKVLHFSGRRKIDLEKYLNLNLNYMM